MIDEIFEIKRYALWCKLKQAQPQSMENLFDYLQEELGKLKFKELQRSMKIKITTYLVGGCL